MKIFWPNTIRNEDLWERTKQEPAETQILRRKWNWIGHTLRKPSTNIARQALSWTPQGKRRVGRPKNTWRRDLDSDLKKINLTWKEAQKQAQDREGWRNIVSCLCSNGNQPA